MIYITMESSPMTCFLIGLEAEKIIPSWTVVLTSLKLKAMIESSWRKNLRPLGSRASLGLLLILVEVKQLLLLLRIDIQITQCDTQFKRRSNGFVRMSAESSRSGNDGRLGRCSRL
jgi:hypothetical protein